MQLHLLDLSLSVCQLETSAVVPAWAQSGPFFNLTKTDEELSIVCPTSVVPDHIKRQDHWRAIKVEGPLDFSLTGILSTLLKPLAQAQISIFAISTFNTDYILIQDKDLQKAVLTLKNEGHQIYVSKTKKPQPRPGFLI